MEEENHNQSSQNIVLKQTGQSSQLSVQNGIESPNQPLPQDSHNSLTNSKLASNSQTAHNFVSSKNQNSKVASGRGIIPVQDYQSNNMAQHQNMYSSNDSNMALSDHQSAGGLPQSRGQKRTVEPNVIVHSKDQSNREGTRGHSSAVSKEHNLYQGAMGLNRHGQIQNQRVNQSEIRANKLQKNAYEKRQIQQTFPLKVQNLNQLVQIRKKKPKLKYFDKLQVKAQQERQIYSQQIQHRNEPKRLQKILDGFLLLFSCRVKLPHEAIRSKLSGENIVDVREEDLVYFKQNLKYLDISDNSVYLEQLINLQNLEELDIQYNNLDHLQLQEGAFPQLQILHLSYNKIPTSHLSELRYMNKLRVLEIASNDLCTLPSDLSFLKSLEEVNMSSNSFSSDSVLVNPSKLFQAISTIPNLKKLNLSRNRFKAFHSEEFPQDNINQEPPSQVFPNLVELNFAFNLVEQEEDLLFCVTQLPSLLILTVTGNPFAIKGDPFAAANLEQILNQKNGKLINETLQPPTYLRRQKSKRQDGRPPLMLNYNFPQSREMVVVRDNQPLSRAQPHLIHQEAEDLFPMPPKEQQIQAIEYQQEFQQPQIQSDEDEGDQQNENKFFITEDELLRGGKKSRKQTKPQASRDFKSGEIIQEENNDPNIQDEMDRSSKDRQESNNEREQQQVNFDEDFGKIKMERFKDQCRQILGKPRKGQSGYRNSLMEEFDEDQSDEQDSQKDAENSGYVMNRDYDTYLDIINAYKTLKQAVNKPSTVHNPTNLGGSKGYLKMTIAATQHSKSKMNRDILEFSLAHKNERVSNTASGGARALLPQSFDSQDPNATQNMPFLNRRPTWRKTKQEVIDEKVERLFESYKLMDEVNKKQQAIQGIQDKDNKNKHRNKYFPDDDEDDEQ